jgi:cytochrome c peroxidase
MASTKLSSPSRPSRLSGRAATFLLAAGLPVATVGLLAASGLVYALPPVLFPAENPFSEEKRVLGKILFFDEQLSTSNVVACATCHSFGNAGADPRLARHPGDDGMLNTPDDILGSAGIIRSDEQNDFEPDPLFAFRPQITERAANSPINAAFSRLLFWDGRAREQFISPETGQVAIAQRGALESQALQPIVNSVEMAHAGVDFTNVNERLATAVPLNLATNRPADVATALAGRPTYGDLFERAFGDPEITATRIAFAIATYQRTLISDQTPFDRFRAGQQNALTAAQQRGLNAFQGAARCSVCHTVNNDLLTDDTFRNIGLRPPAEDIGRQAVTGLAGDLGRFKVPGLRNVGLKRTFMHNGQFQTLTDVLRFYARAPGAAPQFPENRDPVIPQIALPPNAAADIQDLLQNGMTDPRVANRTFPFDAPTLFSQRPNDQATPIGGGVPGSGGVIPRIVVQAPPMVGNRDFRIGVEGVLGGATLQLAISSSPPVAGRITPERLFDVQTASGVGAGNGYATAHWPLLPDQVSQGQVLFAQWIVTDPGAAGGRALSVVGRLPIFCGASGCPTACGPADINADGFLDFFDYDSFVEAFETGNMVADYNEDQFLDFFDYDDYLAAFETGC